LSLPVGRPCWGETAPSDPRLDQARQYVETSSRYLHHSQLRRGMKGYGLTVMVGTEVVRFDLEIVSVMTNVMPHQDMILGRLSGQNLETTGVIQGMSGSPCYVTHDGQAKMIGAVAFQLAMAQKEPLCGIQPITQMLATRFEDAAPVESSGGLMAAWPSRQEFLATVLDPTRNDLSHLALPVETRHANNRSQQWGPLTTPLMVRGATPQTVDLLADRLCPLGILPVQAGGMGSTDPAVDTQLIPGGAIAIPMVTGDVEFTAIGTVTDVVGDEVLAFGHPFMAAGDVEFPMGPGYVHTVVSGVLSSFKLAAGLKTTGTLRRDEATAVLGRIGPIPSMIPMTVEVVYSDAEGQSVRQHTYRYRIVRHRVWTPLMTGYVAMDSGWAWQELPDYHTVRHSVRVNFEGLDSYVTDDFTSGENLNPVISDLVRPISALLNNPMGPPPKVDSIAVRIEVQPVAHRARILQLKLDGQVYQPGDTLTGMVLIEPFRQKRREIPIAFDLPPDLPEGTYHLKACDSIAAVKALKRERPHWFEPKTIEQLMTSLTRVVQTRGNQLYLRLPIPQGGLALGQKELPEMPPSKAAILRQAEKLEARTFSKTLVREVDGGTMFNGSATAKFKVQSEPTETLVGRKEDPL